MSVGPVAPTIAIFVMTGINAEHFRAYPNPNDPQSPYKPILRRINDGARFGSKADMRHLEFSRAMRRPRSKTRL
jgi:hypothetical protein